MSRQQEEKGMIRKEEEVLSQGQVQPRILVVDDDHLSVQVVSRMMKAIRSTATVDTANGAVAAMNSLGRHRYDIVITDLEMPDVNGYALACWLKEKSKETKVIIMTGRSHSDVEKFRNNAMVDCWLFKPFGINDLKAALKNIVQPDKQDQHPV